MRAELGFQKPTPACGPGARVYCEQGSGHHDFLITLWMSLTRPMATASKATPLTCGRLVCLVCLTEAPAAPRPG